MAPNDIKLTCTICEKNTKKHQLLLGTVICKNCLEKFEVQRLEPLQRYGEITFKSGGTFFKPFWVKARGEITKVGTDQVKAVFSKKGSEVMTGKRFLGDPTVEKTLAFITDNGGRVEIDGGKLELEMSGGVLLSTRRAFPLREKGQWAFGILFSRLVEFYKL